MSRREFITLLGCAAAWPFAAQAQQVDRVRRVGALMGFRENDPEGTLWLSSFTRAFEKLDWIDGRNVRMNVRWDPSNSARFARELVDLHPDVILAHGTPLTAALQRKHEQFPLYLGPFPTRSARASLKVYRTRAGILLDSSSQREEWVANGLSCSKSSHLALSRL